MLYWHCLTMRKNLLLIIVLLTSHWCTAQETTQRKYKTAPDVTAVSSVLKNDYTIKQGSYAAYYKKKTLVAAGRYNHNVKVGAWTYFDTHRRVMQRYDYTKKKLIYEAPDDSLSNFRYAVDDTLTQQSRVTKPVRLGGRYYGYLPYINLVKLPADVANTASNANSQVQMELLISPYGRLAEFRVRIVWGWGSVFNPIVASTVEDRTRILTLNLNLMSDEDKTFIPATFNNEPIPCRIFIPCRFDGSDRIVLAQ